MASLYNLTNEYVTLMEWMSDPETDAQAIQDTLDGIQYELEQKAEAYCMVIRQFEADAEAYKKEEERFSQKRAICENNAKRMKEALMKAMVATGHDDKNGLTAGLFKLKVAGNGGKMPLKITGEVPSQFVRMVPQNDTDGIRSFLESLGEGDTCAWAHLEPRGTHLSIK